MARAFRVFISYRRSDNITMTGRIHDRLSGVFGDTAVFRDMEDIPIGSDFRKVIEAEIEQSSVLLAIIGRNWLDAVDAQGQRRLHDPNDFVRIEIESALKRPDMLVIPVLIDGVTMPKSADLPESLHDLAYRNAAVVRNDPDFNRDIEDLTGQIRQHRKLTAPLQLPRPLAVLFGLALVLAAALLVLFLNNRQPSNSPTGQPISQRVATLEPVPENRYLVLVAEPEPLRNPVPRDVARFVVEDLKRTLEVNIPYSSLSIRRYTGVIKSDSEAASVAQANGASVVVWGSYTDSNITLNVQVGSLDRFPSIKFDMTSLQRIGNVQVQLDDERIQSVAVPVMSALYVLQLADSDFLGLCNSLVVMSLIKNEPATYVGETAGTQLQRALIAIPTDFAAAKQHLDQAIENNSESALLYGVRAFINFQNVNLTAGKADATTALRYAPNWLLPKYLPVGEAFRQGKYADAVARMDEIVKARSKDWFPLYIRGMIQYLGGNITPARIDIEQASQLNPNTNFTYLCLAAIYLHEGRVLESQQQLVLARQQAIDITYMNRMLRIWGAFSSGVIESTGIILANMIIGQHSVVENETATMLAGGGLPNSDFYLARGVALCGLDRLDEAEAAYNAGLELDSQNAGLYLVRANLRIAQGNPLGALADFDAAKKVDGSAVPDGLITISTSGQLTCKNFLDADSPLLAELTAATQTP